MIVDPMTLLAFAMVIVFMFVVMTKRMPALIALIIVPVVFALVGGFGRDVGTMMLDGVMTVTPSAVMLLFAILYFGVMSDAGLFDPAVRRILHMVGGDPLRITVGTAILTIFVSLDGDGSTTYIITVSALIGLYKQLNMNLLVLACIIMLAVGVTNITPWGGPTARAATALGISPSEIFNPMIPAMVGCCAWVIVVAYMFGLRERRRLGVMDASLLHDIRVSAVDQKGNGTSNGLRRPRLYPVNLLLTGCLMAALMLEALPLPVLFMIAFAIAMMLNYPTLDEQKARIAAHAGSALSVVSLIFAAGIFTGILTGTKMVDALAHSVIAVVPDAMGPYLAVITGVLSIPCTFFISNDAFYFGIVPILAKAAAVYGISPAEIGRAAVIGQPVHLLSPLVPSTYLLVGLVKVELGDHQRFTLKWTIMTSLVMLVIGVLTGVIPIVGREL